MIVCVVVAFITELMTVIIVAETVAPVSTCPPAIQADLGKPTSSLISHQPYKMPLFESHRSSSHQVQSVGWGLSRQVVFGVVWFPIAPMSESNQGYQNVSFIVFVNV